MMRGTGGASGLTRCPGIGAGADRIEVRHGQLNDITHIRAHDEPLPVTLAARTREVTRLTRSYGWGRRFHVGWFGAPSLRQGKQERPIGCARSWAITP